jgi:hypothetical protein
MSISCPGKKKSAIFVHITDDECRLILEAVVDPIAVMSIDVDVGDTSHVVVRLQHFYQHSAVVEDAETTST